MSEMPRTLALPEVPLAPFRCEYHKVLPMPCRDRTALLRSFWAVLPQRMRSLLILAWSVVRVIAVSCLEQLGTLDSTKMESGLP